MKATLTDIAAWCGGTCENTAGGTTVQGVSFDTRALRPGDLFMPLASERPGAIDGHDYLDAAREAGAAASLWQRSRPLPASPGIPLLLVDDPLTALQQMAGSYLAAIGARVVGVTGSNGKTTTKDYVSSVLATRFRVHKTEGNFNNHIGLPVTILQASPDTEVLVLEMGMSERGEISFLSRLAKPDIAIITNIGESHLLQLGSRRNIALAKLEIAEGLKPNGVLILNGDEPLLAEELARTQLPEGCDVLTYGEGESCGLKALDVVMSADRTRFTAVADGTPESFEISVPGKHNALNALAAVAVGRRMGLPREDIAAGLRGAKLTGMRIERSRAANGALLLNDAYNASPTSMRAAIHMMAGLSGYRSKRLVLGDMLELGPDEEAFHADIGRAVTPESADCLYAFGPLSAHMAKAAQAMPAGTVRHFTDKGQLAETLLRETGPDDLVLVKASRGMKMEEIVAALQKGDVR